MACGNGKLLSLALGLKKEGCSYLASDLSPVMVEQSKSNLRNHFQRYQSKLCFEEWCAKQNIAFDVVNAEQPIPSSKPFDRIICNLALMITPDPKKVLSNLHAVSKPGCLFGVNVWGNKK